MADALHEPIVEGTWPIGSQIPTLPDLAREFGVGLITVRQAVQLLRNEQLVEPEQGRGTFVRNQPQTHPRMQVETSLAGLAERYRYLQRMHASGRQPTSIISAFLDDRIFRLAPKRFRNELIIPVLMDLLAQAPGPTASSMRAQG